MKAMAINDFNAIYRRLQVLFGYTHKWGLTYWEHTHPSCSVYMTVPQVMFVIL